MSKRNFTAKQFHSCKHGHISLFEEFAAVEDTILRFPLGDMHLVGAGVYYCLGEGVLIERNTPAQRIIYSTQRSNMQRGLHND